jgi:hypothetical protein
MTTIDSWAATVQKGTYDLLVDISDVPLSPLAFYRLCICNSGSKNLLLDLLDVWALEAVIAVLIGSGRGNARRRGFGSLEGLGGLLLRGLGRLNSLSSHRGRMQRSCDLVVESLRGDVMALSAMCATGL